jgi:hypothetical protein
MGNESEATGLGFVNEAGVSNYSICLTSGKWGMRHDLPQEGRCQLLKLNHFL